MGLEGEGGLVLYHAIPPFRLKGGIIVANQDWGNHKTHQARKIHRVKVKIYRHQHW
jgi:hypothetical protein